MSVAVPDSVKRPGVINSTICPLLWLRKGHNEHIFVDSSSQGSRHSPCSENANMTAYSAHKAAAKRAPRSSKSRPTLSLRASPSSPSSGLTEGGRDPKTPAKSIAPTSPKPQNGNFFDAQGQEMLWETRARALGNFPFPP